MMARMRCAMNRRWSLFLRAAIISSIGVALFTLTRRDTPESAYAEGAVAIAREYIMAKEGWSPDAYMVKDTSTRDRAGNLIVNVIHKDDLKRPLEAASPCNCISTWR